MEAEGVITANVALISQETVGLPLTIIVDVELVSETPGAIGAPGSASGPRRRYGKCYYVTGDAISRMG
jgi:Lrp/AsnC family transcriptional regulator, leucine-responsive regulatory protein